MRPRAYLLSPCLLGLTAILALFFWIVLPAESVIGLMAEDGPIENITVIAYFIAIAALWFWRASDLPTRLSSSLVLLMFAAREMDLHRTLFGISMLKSRFYLSGPVLPRLTALAILLPLAIALVFLARKYTGMIWRELVLCQPVAVSLGCFIAALVISKVIDRSLNLVFELFSYASPDWLKALQLAFEETLELLLPILAMVAGWQSSRRGRLT